MKQVLFVCVENANRSQMAEAFARHHGSDVVEAVSAGSRPAAAVNPRAVAALHERGIEVGERRPRSLQEIPEGRYEYVVTMGCGDACPWVQAAHREDWELPDPRNLPPLECNKIRDEIERRVLRLLDRIRASTAS
jgi:protein-tyrosine-phosphatase